MIISGPFESGVNYIPDIYQELTQESSKVSIEIHESNLSKHKYLSFLFKQNAHRFHRDTIFAYIRTPDISEMLHIKPSPTQVSEFIEYRVRLSSSKFSSNSITELIFKYHGRRSSILELKNLTFGPCDYEDIVIIPQGFILQSHGGGITSPVQGYVPTSPEEVVDIYLHPYTGYEPKLVSIYGTICDENGNVYPKQFIPQSKHFKVKLPSIFDSCQILVKFGRIS